MATLGRLTTVFDADTVKFKAGSAEVQKGLAGVEKSINSVSSSARGFAGGILPGLASISEIIQGIPQIGRLAGGLIRPLTDAAEEGIRLNMVLETAKIGFEGVAGSAEKSGKHIAALMAFGQSSPFRFEGLLEASRFMTAFGFELDEQIPKLTVWGNALAASGELSASKVQDVVRAFGQMRMAGRVNAQDMNQLTNANIPGWELLAKAIGKTVAQTRKLSEAGKLEGKSAVEAITAMMAQEPRFKDMMKRMEGTGAGRLSAAQDVIQFAQAKATTSLTQDISTTLGAALQRQNVVSELAGSINNAITPVSALIRTAAVGVLGGGLTSGFIEGIQAGKDAVKAAVGDFALDGIIGTAKGWLGIQSPSTVFYDMGLMSAQGFALGLQEGFRDNPIVRELEKLLEDPRMRAFFEAIKKAEGGSLNVMAGGRRVDSGAQHPGEVVPKSQWFRGDKGRSSAAGNYQITRTNWRVIAAELGLDNFSDPHQQLLAAVKLFRDRREGAGVQALQSGDIVGARNVAALDWTSTPGSKIGGGGQVGANKWMGHYNQALSSMSVGGREVSSSNPFPVYLVTGGVGGNGSPLMSFGAPQNAERSGAMRPAGFTDLTDAQAGMVVDRFKAARGEVLATTTAANNLTISFKAVAEVAGIAAEQSQGQALAAGEWAKVVIQQTDDLGTRLRDISDSLPTFRENFNDIVSGLPEGLGNIFGDAVHEWDLTMKGFLTSLGQGVQRTLSDIASMVASSAIKNAFAELLAGLSSGAGKGGFWGGLLKTIFGAAVGGAAGGAGGGGGSGYAGMGNVYVGGYASGGIVPGVDRGYDSVPAMLTPGELVLTKEQQRGMGQQVVNKYYTINLPPAPNSSYNPRRSARQHADMVLAALQGAQ